jgi:hypothetical protein
MRKTLLLASSLLALSLSANAAVDWNQESARGQDIAIGHTGDQWFVGQDGKTYQWNGSAWQAKGGRSDFARIDVGDNGAAALSDSGMLYVNGGKGWQSTGVRAEDVGIGGGKIWLASARNKNGGKITLYGAFDGSTNIQWQSVKGTLERLDVDPQGRPWGIDNDGKVFVYSDNAWIEDVKAPSASDIGVGGDGSLYVVGADINKELGGGRVYLRDGQSGEWTAQAGRLSAISVTPDGKAFGVNSLNWVMSGTAEGSSFAKNESGNLPDNTTFTVEGTKTLADILGSAVPGADKITLSKVEVTQDTIAGTVELDGSPVRALLHQPNPKETVFIAGLEHASVDLGTYIPKIRDTNLGSFGLANAVFYMQGEEAEAIEYASFDDMPTPLSKLLEIQKNFKDLFPLTIHPGVTVIGTYDPNNKNAKAVMKAYGMDEAGYTVKGNFKLSQLQNLSFDFPSMPSKPSNNKEACESTSTAGLSGLDLTFPISVFKPPYAKSAIAFNKTKFSLKEIDGRIEPSVITGMTLTLPEKKIGIKNIPMAGKLAVRGDLNVLCNGVSTETEGIISFAAATTFNADKIGNTAIEALSRVTEDGTESPNGDGLGWKKAFGIPFLNIRQYAAAGVFEQKDEGGILKRTLSTTTWSDVIVDRAKIDVFGTMDYEIKPDALEVTDWSFEMDGPVAFNDLPGLKDMPKVDEFSIKNIALTPSEMTGALLRQNKDIQATAYLSRAGDEFSAFLQFDNLTPSAIYDFIPKVVSDVTLSPALIAWSNKETRELKYADAPIKLKPLLNGLIEKDDALTIGKGLTLGGRTAPEKIFKGRLTNLFKGYIEVVGDVGMFGVFAKNDAGKMNGELRVMLDTFKVKNIPESLITFKDSEIVLSNVEGSAIEIETSANMQAPGNNTLLDLSGTLIYEETSENKNALSVELTSDYLWNNPFKIPELQVSNLGFKAAFERDGNTSNQNISLIGDGILRKQEGKVSIDFDSMNGDPEFAAVIFDGNLKVSELLSLPAGAEKIADATFRKIVLGTNAIGGDLSFNANGLEFDGRGAVIFDNDGAALFLRHDKDLAIGKMVNDIPTPFRDVTIPKGLLIVSPKAINSFDANYIPDAIYDDVLGGLVDDDTAQNLLVEDGLTFMTKINPSGFPAPIPAMLKTPFGIKDEVYIAGSVGGMFGGGDPSLGFYTILKGVTPDLPSFVKEFIAFKDSNMKLFVKSTKGATGGVDVGISADAKIKPRRLDDPTIVQELDGTFALTYSAQGTGTSITSSASVTGQWEDPMGLEGYSFQNPSFAFGIEEKGVTIGVHTDRADFSQSGTNKAFVFDLDTTWTGAVPTDLAMQFAKAKDTKELILTPVDLARVQKSIFDLAFRSGSKIKGGILAGLDQVPTFGDPALELVKNNAPDVINKFTVLLDGASDGMFSLIEKSPLSMIGVTNPQVYFGTPGSTPPSNPDIERPPLGLGLHVAGSFTVDMGELLKAELASGVYKINLRDGYFVEGSVTPPSPFTANTIKVAGNMPLFGGPQYLRFSGNLEVPGAEVVGISLGINGNFDVTRGSILEPKASVAADVSIGGVLGREGTMSLNGTSLSFNSPSGCTDIPPLDISGSLSLNSFTAESMTQAILVSFTPSIPDPVECAGDLFEKFTDIAEGAIDVVTDPLGNAEAMGEKAGELLTNPGETLEKAGQLATAPMDVADALAGAGISLVTMGVEQVPVLGPGAGRLLGEGFDKANQLKNMAMNALTNNQLTGWMTDSFGSAAGSVANLAQGAANEVGEFLGFDDSEPPKWYGINALKCAVNQHYWNPAFKQCFENDAIVLFDDASRTNGKLGDCITYNHADKHSLKVGICTGTGFNQLHLDSARDQIKTSASAYNGYVETYLGPGPVCFVRKGNSITLDSCHNNVENTKWTFTDDMKLRNGDKCMTRDSSNRVVMGTCSSATKWLGTSIVPNWNMVEGVAPRGQIQHVASGNCLYWTSTDPKKTPDPFALKDCSHDAHDPDYYHRYLATHQRIQVLDQHHTVALNGAAPWGGWDIYGCVGLRGTNLDGVMARHCWPHLIYEESKWKVYAVINGNLDTSNSIPLKDILSKHEYVFKNVQNGKCLSEGTYMRYSGLIRGFLNAGPYLSKVEDCTNIISKVKAKVKFRGYASDALAQLALDKKVRKEKRAWEAKRYKMLPILTDWQQYRIRAENARIEEVHKIASSFNSNIKSVQINRTSPGHCKHDEYWNQTLKICSKGRQMILKYHNSNGDYKGCLRSASSGLGVNAAFVKGDSCNTQDEYGAVIDIFALLMDDKGRIVKKNREYWANIQKSEDEEGKSFYFDAGNTVVEQGDSCLDIRHGYAKIEGLDALKFYSCGERSMRWKYSPQQGELVTEDGRCVRTRNVPSTSYTTDKNTGEKIFKNYDVFVLGDCKKDPMQLGKRRFVPTIGYDFSMEQSLPRTAKIKRAGNDNLCISGNMVINGDAKLEACTLDNKDQYFSFGGTDKTRFLISSRNSKTCLYDSGTGSVSHRPCRGSGAEMFMKINQDDGTIKLQNALSGQCLGQDDDEISQIDCSDAPSFIFETIESIDGIEFEPTGLLQADVQRTAQAQDIWNIAKKRAEYIYMGAYLGGADGSPILQKGENDEALIAAPSTVELEKLPSHIDLDGSTVIYIPAIEVPKTQILTLPGFDSGAKTVTFVYARPVEFTDGKPTRDHTSDPYAANYPDWVSWAHYQKVLRIMDDGTIKFDYIDESDKFRKSASFKLVETGVEDVYSFESVSNPGQYLQETNGTLTLGAAKTTFTFESTAKWFKSGDINPMDFGAPYRAPKPPYKNLKYPEDGWVLKQ